MQKITCRCDTVVEIDAPDCIDLDSDPLSLHRMAEGDTPSAVCPRCGALLRAELPLAVQSKERGIDLVVLSEKERLSVYRGKADPKGSSEIVLGYKELFERAKALDDGLDPRAVEVMKYALQSKAEEAEPDAETSVLYNGLKHDSLEFHILGLKSGQAGVIKLPRSSYDKVLVDLASTMSKEPMKTVFSGRYKSISKLGFLASTSEPD